MGSEGAAGEKNMHDAEFTCTLFRFVQLTCEGHNLGKFKELFEMTLRRLSLGVEIFAPGTVLNLCN